MLTSMYAYTLFFFLQLLTIYCCNEEFSFPSTRAGPKDASNASTSTEVPPAQLQKIPQRLQSFRDIRTSENFVFVDKTNYINELIDNDEIYSCEKIYFLARPRTFGKSLFLQMVQEFLKGSKKLFSNTIIFSRKWNTYEENVKRNNIQPHEWINNPVIYLDFEGLPTTNAKIFQKRIEKKITAIAESYSIDTSKASDETPLEWLVYALQRKFNSRVSILIDNYDNSIDVFMEKDYLCRKKCKQVLQDFYIEIIDLSKSEVLWLVLIFGTSKLNVIEELNGRVTDITNDPRFSSILGFTDIEVKKYFKSYLDKLTDDKKNVTISDIIREMNNRYGGYYFSTEQDDLEIMNAGSVCSYLKTQKLRDYEPRTKILTDVILPRMRNEQRTIRYFSFLCIHEDEVELKVDWLYRETIPLYKIMLYNGYLSIKFYRPGHREICVGFPNVGIQTRINSGLPPHLQIGDELNLPHNITVKEIFLELLRNNDIRRFVEMTMLVVFPNLSPSLSASYKLDKDKDKDKGEFPPTREMHKLFKLIGLACRESIPMLTETEQKVYETKLNETKFNETGKKFATKNITAQLCGDLDLVIFSSEEDTPHYVIEVKFQKPPEKAILQLIGYVVNQSIPFEQVVQECYRTEMINLVGLIFKFNKYHGNVIWKWIMVPYSTKDDKIKINQAKASDNNIIRNLKKQLMIEQYYEKNKDRFIL